ncbi:sensor histidine kinase [Nocardia sp. NPDC052566]|uniref:sensor histidine kinase n=1 Tax=Nocardia sp. NPDC052566 TaxID=3364330 RepID=UPI0037C695F8
MDRAPTIGPEATSFLRSNIWYRLWAWFVVIGCAATAGAVFLLDRQFPANRFGAILALASIVAWTFAFARGRADGQDRLYLWRELTWRTEVFVVGVLALFAVAIGFAGAAVAVLPVVYSLVYLALPLRAGLAAAAVASVLPGALALLTEGVHGPDVPLALVISGVGLISSPVIGTAIRVAVERGAQQAVLLDELARSRAEAARLSREAGQSAERARLAREIHDTLAQGFTSIVALAQAAEMEVDSDPAAARRHIGFIGATARENLAEARSMVVELTPSALAAGSLVDSVRRQGDRLTEETGIAVTIDVAADLPDIGTAGEVVLLRAAQEAFANVRKHAEARTVVVELAPADSGVRLSVADDGIGFAPDDATGFGLRGMRERVEQAGGTVAVSSARGSGTRVEVEIPR